VTLELSITSPCSSICSLNEDDVCVGCNRTSNEIRDWRNMSDSEKLEVLTLCSQRIQGD
jgi:predicted Fe-S protein YdhL (DUF1289 family)